MAVKNHYRVINICFSVVGGGVGCPTENIPVVKHNHQVSRIFPRVQRRPMETMDPAPLTLQDVNLRGTMQPMEEPCIAPRATIRSWILRSQETSQVDEDVDTLMTRPQILSK